jgi:hypothetical protein
MPRARSQAERDSVTVEMVFAALTGAILAVAGFTVTALPVLAGQAHGAAREGWLTAAVVVATAAFCCRVAWVLRRFERLARPDRQPSQPGRAKPDS